MLRLLLILLVLVGPGCSCESRTSSPDAASPDAGMPADSGQLDAWSAFVDARPRDSSLPCDGTLALLRVDRSSLPPAYQRSRVQAAREGEGLVLGWFNEDRLATGQWLLARIRDPDAPRAELVDPLPLPGLVGFFTNERDGVRVVMTEDPNDGLSRGAWADLQPDGTFGALHRFERPPDLPPLWPSPIPCTGTDAFPLFSSCSSMEPLAVTILRIDSSGARFFEPAVSARLGSCSFSSRSGYGPFGCVGHRGLTSALVIPADPTRPPAVAEWRPDGTLLHDDVIPLDAAGEVLTGVAAADDAGPIYFVLAGSPNPRAWAFRIVGNEAVTLDEAPLDPFPDPVAGAIGAVRLADGRFLLAYLQSHVLSVIDFDEGEGFGRPAIVARGYVSGGGRPVQIGSKVYLPLDGLWLLRVCGEA